MIRRLATTIAIAGALVSSVLPGMAMAAPPVAYERVYYAEAEHSTAVGGMYRPCPAPGAMVTTWGASSPYYTEEIFPCEE